MQLNMFLCNKAWESKLDGKIDLQDVTNADTLSADDGNPNSNDATLDASLQEKQLDISDSSGCTPWDPRDKGIYLLNIGAMAACHKIFNVCPMKSFEVNRVDGKEGSFIYLLSADVNTQLFGQVRLS